MPCGDTTSKILVHLTLDDHLKDFDFAKMTCRKEIGGETGFLPYCKNFHIDKILDLDFEETLLALGLTGDEDQFFLYLEWEALLAAVKLYKGIDVESDRYRIATIEYDVEEITIVLVVRPLKEMPKKIQSCTARAIKTLSG